MNSVNIRVAAAADLPLILQLDVDIFGTEAYSDDQWISEFDSASVTIFTAVAEETAVGFCSGAIVGDDYEIRKIGVLPAFRRSGVAKELLFFAARAAAQQLPPSARCLIDVAANNAGAISFYLRTGFIEIARRKRYYTNGIDAILMQKGLCGWTP